MNPSLFKRIALLTDDESEKCLNGILKGIISADPNLASIISSPDTTSEVLQKIASESGVSSLTLNENNVKDRPKAIRTVLVELASDEQMSPRIEAWLNTARPKLLEPVTTALIMAGIVIVLSTSVEVKYEKENGKKKLKVDIKKPTISNDIIKKFFGFFKGS